MNNKSVKILKISLLVLVVVSIFCLAGCGKVVSVKITDGKVTTEFEAKSNKTIEKILTDAGIVLGEKDEAVPALEEKLGEATEITVKRYAKVTVKNGKTEKKVELVGGTVKEAVEKAGFKLDKTYKTDVDENELLTDGLVITLKKGVKVNLTLEGKSETYLTHAVTVKEFLSEQEIKLSDDDEVTPSLKSKIKADMEITVKRVEYKEETKTEVIYYTTKETKSSSMAAGTKKVTQNGVNGEKEVTYKVKFVDGKEDSREVVSEKVTKEAVTKLVTVGTKAAAPSGKTVVSKQAVYDCDGSGHGYYVITYADGTVEYEVF